MAYDGASAMAAPTATDGATATAATRKMPSNKFTFDVKASSLFEERKVQFINWGIPEDIVNSLENGINDMCAMLRMHRTKSF